MAKSGNGPRMARLLGPVLEARRLCTGGDGGGNPSGRGGGASGLFRGMLYFCKGRKRTEAYETAMVVPIWWPKGGRAFSSPSPPAVCPPPTHPLFPPTHRPTPLLPPRGFLRATTARPKSGGSLRARELPCVAGLRALPKSVLERNAAGAGNQASK